MNIINNINSQKFSLNGIPYFKNFMGVVIGNRLKIVNAYDSSLQLSELSNFNQYQVNGTIHTSIESLQNALLPVLFTRDTLGNADAYSPYREDFTWQTGESQQFIIPEDVSVKSVYHNRTKLFQSEYTVNGNIVTITYTTFDPNETNIITIEN